MSPLNIGILLHYHTSATDYAAAAEPRHGQSIGVTESLESLVNSGLLSSRFTDISWSIRQSVAARADGPILAITDKGTAMVQAMMDVQVPICKWVQP